MISRPNDFSIKEIFVTGFTSYKKLKTKSLARFFCSIAMASFFVSGLAHSVFAEILNQENSKICRNRNLTFDGECSALANTEPANGHWEEVTGFDPCKSPITGNTSLWFDQSFGLYTGMIESSEWRVKVGYGSGSIVEVGGSCESALTTNPALVCSPGNMIINKENGDSYYSCEESKNEQWWWGYWLVHEWTCSHASACRHYSTILYNGPGGAVYQVVNDSWSVSSQQVLQLWRWVCDE